MAAKAVTRLCFFRRLFFDRSADLPVIAEEPASNNMCEEKRQHSDNKLSREFHKNLSFVLFWKAQLTCQLIAANSVAISAPTGAQSVNGGFSLSEYFFRSKLVSTETPRVFDSF